MTLVFHGSRSWIRAWELGSLYIKITQVYRARKVVCINIDVTQNRRYWFRIYRWIFEIETGGGE